MSVLLAISGVVVALVLAFLRGLATDEARGRLQRRVTENVEATIASLPQDLQEKWADEWRAELAAASSMPLTAILFARGLRQTASQLVDSVVRAPAGIVSPSQDWVSPVKLPHLARNVWARASTLLEVGRAWRYAEIAIFFSVFLANTAYLAGIFRLPLAWNAALQVFTMIVYAVVIWRRRGELRWSWRSYS